MLAAELQQVLNTVSENQLQSLRTLQEDTNKYINQLTKLISDSTKSPVTGVPKPAPFSGHADEDFNLWLDHFKAIVPRYITGHKMIALNCYMFFLLGQRYVTSKVSMWRSVIILTQQLLP